MEFLKRAYDRVRALFKSRMIEREMDKEMRLHLDLLAKEYEEAGMTAADAKAAARRRFGNRELIKERSRDIRGAGILEDVRRDFQYAVRMIRRGPVFAAVIVVSLALGIGANTAMYSAIDAMFLRELPLRNPGELVVFGWQSGPTPDAFSPRRGGVFGRVSGGSGESRIMTNIGVSFSSDLVERFRAQGETLSGAAAFANADIDAAIDDSGDEITAQLVSGNYFQTLGVSPAQGRTITPDDDQPSANAVVVVSHGFWRRRFALDPSAIGKHVLLNGTLPATIVGVTPPDFHVGRGVVPDFSIPLAFESQLAPGLRAPENWGLAIVGRMKPGRSIEQVRSNLQGLFQDFALQEAPNTAPADMPRLEVFSAAQGFTREIISDNMRPNVRSYLMLLIVSGAVAVLLLIVCLNVANLLIARASTRRYEIGVRLAMGAGRFRLIRQLLTESVTLALIGGAFGIVLTYLGKDLLRLFLQQNSRMILDLRVDSNVLAFSAVVSLLTGILFGISPAFRATRMDLNSAVKQGNRTLKGSRAGIGRVLLVIQVAMSVVLLVGASLLLRTVGNLPSTDVGFITENMLSFTVNVQTLSGDRARYEQIIETIDALPAVAAVTTSSDVFLGPGGSFTNGRFYAPGESQESVRTEIRLHTVRDNFFETLGIPVIRGRGFEQSDVSGPPVVVITESLARQLPADPIGWRIQIGLEGAPRYLDVVGVVKNIGASEVGRPIEGTVFFAESQQPSLMRAFEVRTIANPMTTIAPIREVLRRIDPNLRAAEVATEKELVDRKLAPTRYIAVAWAGFGGVALLLTSIGLYGLLSHSVARRTNEIGIRIALGARRFHVLRLVMGQVFILVFIGLSMGLALSLAINVLISAFIYGVTFNDSLTFSLAAAIMLAVTAAASYLPARRASRVDPTVALRYE